MAYISFQPSDFFNTVLWAGNSTDPTSITGVGFQPDMLWIKNRSSGSYNHHLVDSSRGVSNRLVPNGTQAEGTSFVNSFSSDGFSLTDNATVNGSSNNYVGWNWKSNGGTTSSNTDGSITSTVQANTTSGFSIVTYTGTGSNATIGHGLGVKPKFIIIKRRSAGEHWTIFHDSLGATKYLYFTTNAAITGSGAFNNTNPTTSVFSVGTDDSVNSSGGTFVAYCFAETKGFCRLGAKSYTGNGSTDGPFVYTGFRPAFLILKRIDSTSNWTLYDSARNPYNRVDELLYPNLSNDESQNDNGRPVDFLSNGFKLRGSSTEVNASGGSYVFIAFAEFPLIGSNGIVGTAR